jgi:hypothetical protein
VADLSNDPNNSRNVINNGDNNAGESCHDEEGSIFGNGSETSVDSRHLDPDYNVSDEDMSVRDGGAFTGRSITATDDCSPMKARKPAPSLIGESQIDASLCTELCLTFSRLTLRHSWDGGRQD